MVYYSNTVKYCINVYTLSLTGVMAATCPLLRVSGSTAKCVQTLTSVRTALTEARLTTMPLSVLMTRVKQLSTWVLQGPGREH